MLNKLLFIWLLWLPILSLAQNDSTYSKTRATYIEEKKDAIAISFFNRNPNNQIVLQSRFQLTYKPNDPNTIGLKLQHKWLGFSIGYSPKRLQTEKRGNTSEFDLHFYMYGKKQYLDFYYIDYQGFYIENFKQNDTLRKYYTNFPLYPNLKLNTFGINYFHLFNHKKLSLRASFNHNEIQRKSAGSFLLGTSFNYSSFFNPTDFIPSELRPQTLENERFIDLRYYELSVMPGYAFTLVWKKFYFTFAPMIGFVGQYQRINHTEQLETKQFTTAFRGLSKVALGYNNERVFVALTGTNDTYNYMLNEHVKMRTQVSEARLIIGYRFTPKGFLKKFSNALDVKF